MSAHFCFHQKMTIIGLQRNEVTVPSYFQLKKISKKNHSIISFSRKLKKFFEDSLWHFAIYNGITCSVRQNKWSLRDFGNISCLRGTESQSYSSQYEFLESKGGFGVRDPWKMKVAPISSLAMILSSLEILLIEVIEYRIKYKHEWLIIFHINEVIY